MKRYYFTIAAILVLAIGITSCSNEETKTQKQIAARPTVPTQNGEVQIGTQIWMTKNLNVSRYRNGDPIPQVTDPTQWASLTTGAWCYYNNDPTNGPIYGKLYNWFAINDPRGLAPTGSHVPTDAEWTTLTTFLGGEAVAGGKIKSIGTTLWLSPNTGAINSSGFTGLPGGDRNALSTAGFENLSTLGNWWSSTEGISTGAWDVQTVWFGSIARRVQYVKNVGLSVRCIKD